MREPSHPLDRPLPSDVAAGESAFIQFYQKYAVFSWQWAWRRTLLFGSIGALAGILFGISHGLFVKDIGEAVAVSLACATANVLLVGAGPVLAAIFRHRDWPRNIERALIVAAVISGMAIGILSDNWSSAVHDSYMSAHGFHSSGKMQPASDVHMFVRQALDVGQAVFILFVCSGGLALPAYFSEKRRWAEHWRRVEILKMSLARSEADLRLTLLQAQVEPHFLFNTLASVRSLVSSDPQRAAQTIDALAAHLRTTLPKIRSETGQPKSTLGEQFAICSSYLDLMKVRLGERLRVEIDLPAELRDVPFPPLLLISLVENAIKHGAEPKPGVTLVAIAARAIDVRNQDRLVITVEDDGAGLKLGMGDGTGLANIRSQLLTRFGADASFELTERSTRGVMARLVIPLEPRKP